MSQSAKPALYMQYGCGLSAPSGWLNFDASPTLRLQRLPLIGRLFTIGSARFPSNVRYGDVVKGLPVDTGSCRGVYSSHVLEHLPFEDAKRALRETFRCVAPGGLLRIVLPDLELFAREYLEKLHAEPATTLMRCLQMGQETRPRGFLAFLRSWLGNQKHLWMWDFESLSGELTNVGFVEIRRAQYGDSADPRFAEVEEWSRWDGFLGLEARKRP
jgi:SAM-dependent methyltransferase